MKTIGSLNKKGGVGKTSTLLGIAFGLRKLGLRVGVIDCDPNGSATRWLTDIADIDSVVCDHHDLANLLLQVAEDYDIVLIDSPPNDSDAIASVAAVSDLVIVPLAPTGIETDQLADTAALIPAGVPWVVVPVRVRMSTLSGREIRRLLDDNSVPRTKSIITMSEAIASSFGERTPNLAFAGLTTEILTRLDDAA